MGKSKSKLQWQQIVIVGLCIALLGGGYWAYSEFVLQSETGGFDSAALDYFAFDPAIIGLSAEDNADVTFSGTEYYFEKGTFTDTQLVGKLYADYSVGETISSLDSADTFDRETEELQVFLISQTDCWNVWVKNPVPGLEPIAMINASAAANVVLFEKYGNSATFNQSTYESYVGYIFAETGDEDFVQGFPGYCYDFPTNAYNRTGVAITFNTTISNPILFSNADFIVNVGATTYLLYNSPLLSTDPIEVEFTLDDDVGSTFVPVSATAVMGSTQSSFTSISSAYV